MCGIVGYSSRGRYDDALQLAMKAMYYRGPDSDGKKTIKIDGRYIGVGHVRLKILDLDDRSSQPFITQSGNSLIVYNGEIYNFEALKSTLPDHRWRTTSDTEVVAELLESFGESVVAKFNGIYSIARVCLLTGQLTLLRDPLGVKPLYYSLKDGEVFFASEIKALYDFPVSFKVSTCDLFESLNFGYVHEPNTGFESIKKVAPGTILSFNEKEIDEKPFTFELETDELSEELIVTSLKRQVISDVPIGTFFSGGADSSVIASQVEGDLLYINGNLGQEGDSEQNYAKELSLIFKRKLLIAQLPAEDNLKKILNIIDDVVAGVEEPISDLTYKVSSDLAWLAKSKGFTVMLSGMGADELFGGYLRYYIIKYKWFFNPLFRSFLLLNKFKVSTGQHKIDRIKNYLDEKSLLKKYARLIGYFSSNEIEKCFGEKAYGKYNLEVFDRLKYMLPKKVCNDELSSIRFLEMKGFLSHNLTVADKSSMKSSVELRVPLLDLSLVSGWFGVNYEKVGIRNLGKKPLIKLLRKYVPFKWSPFSKTGFNPSISNFFKKINKTSLKDEILSKDMLEIFDKDGLESVVDSCLSKEITNHHKLWQLLFISRWLHHWNNFADKN